MKSDFSNEEIHGEEYFNERFSNSSPKQSDGNMSVGAKNDKEKCIKDSLSYSSYAPNS